MFDMVLPLLGTLQLYSMLGPELCQFGCFLGADERVLTPKT